MSKKDSITISKKTIAGIAPTIAISAVLLSKGKPGELLLFLIGIGIGIYIQRTLKD